MLGGRHLKDLRKVSRVSVQVMEVIRIIRDVDVQPPYNAAFFVDLVNVFWLMSLYSIVFMLLQA